MVKTNEIENISAFLTAEANKPKLLNIKEGEHILKNVTIENDESNLYVADFFNAEKKVFKSEKFFCPTALRTRISNLDAIEKGTTLFIKSNGLKKSNKGRDMYSFFVKVVE